jgi:hypothetical protein
MRIGWRLGMAGSVIGAVALLSGCDDSVQGCDIDCNAGVAGGGGNVGGDGGSGGTGGDAGGNGPSSPLEIEGQVPDFSLADVNGSSASSGNDVSPRDHLQKVSGWYFTHAT